MDNRPIHPTVYIRYDNGSTAAYLPGYTTTLKDLREYAEDRLRRIGANAYQVVVEYGRSRSRSMWKRCSK